MTAASFDLLELARTRSGESHEGSTRSLRGARTRICPAPDAPKTVEGEAAPEEVNHESRDDDAFPVSENRGESAGDGATLEKVTTRNTLPSIRVINQPSVVELVVQATSRSEEGKAEKGEEHRRRMRRRSSRVSFTTIEVREYDRIVGPADPEVEKPLSIDWNFREHEPTMVDDWEESRPPRRGLPELFQNLQKRKQLLKKTSRQKSLAGSLASKAKKIIRRRDTNLV